MSTIQQELNDFLQCELYHTLGAYGATVRRLRDLNLRVARMRRRESDTATDTLFPSDALTFTSRYNEMLRASLHHPEGEGAKGDNGAGSRHPRPEKRLSGRDTRDRWVLDFYRTAISALESIPSGDPRPQPSPLQRFGNVLAVVHDPQRTAIEPKTNIRACLDRTRDRLKSAEDLMKEERSGRHHDAQGSDPGRTRIGAILGDCLTNQRQDRLHTHTVGALVDAHICMHRAEHLMGKSFGEKLTERRKFDCTIERELRRSLMLNTFVYVVGRSVPWAFAEHDEEREYVLTNYQECCRRLSPAYCMWIGHQLSLLALHRRAYTYLLMGKPEKAYNDFHKLRRLIRHLKRQIDASVAQAPGTQAFLVGLDAFADHHSGRIYRSQHAHTKAFPHFNRAAKRLETLERDDKLVEIVRNSRWRVDLLISQAKASYELGLVKRSLLCYARAWRAFLELADTESHACANYLIVDDVIEWLEYIAADTDVDKIDLKRRFTPLVEQFGMVRGPAHLRVLAAEIMMRVGHVLFTLQLPRLDGDRVVRGERQTPEPGASPSDDHLTIETIDPRYPRHDHRLAHKCLTQAARLDPANTFIAADLRKFDYRTESLRDDPHGNHDTQKNVAAPKPVGIAHQWPGGSGEFEEVALVVEYLLQCWLSETHTQTRNHSEASERIARRLLTAFLAHTEDSNVKLAQVYRYLMQEPSRDQDRSLSSATDARVGIELTCLRRYSSFFPFVPRPSAFPILGGGYFARVTAPHTPDRRPFGVAIDPGPDFISNLYRCGYSLADLHMIVATHDHADHIAALDALLVLLGYRYKFGDRTFGKGRKLAIVGNESVRQRYGFFNDEGRPDSVSVWSFEEWERATSDRPESSEQEKRLAEVKRCPGLRLERVETEMHRDAARKVAQGFLLKVQHDDDRVSVLFTSDSGTHPSLASHPRPETTASGKPIATALGEAAVVVAHLSSTPLSQLRELAKLDTPPETVAPETEEFARLWNGLREQIVGAEVGADSEDEDWAHRREFLLSQLQFGFHSRPNEELEESDTRGLEVSPLSPTDDIAKPSKRHLYLSGLLPIAEHMEKRADLSQVLVVGELREELGTFRTGIARALNTDIFNCRHTRAFTADIGLQIRVLSAATQVLCTTCTLNNDLVDSERFHKPSAITEVCVKGEHEGVFYYCDVHEPLVQPRPVWVERIERYDPFGH